MIFGSSFEHEQVGRLYDEETRLVCEVVSICGISNSIQSLFIVSVTSVSLPHEYELFSGNDVRSADCTSSEKTVSIALHATATNPMNEEIDYLGMDTEHLFAFFSGLHVSMRPIPPERALSRCRSVECTKQASTEGFP